VRLPFDPPVEPMLAKPSGTLPEGEGWLYEPKWDGFRALVFRDGDELLVQSRDLKPLQRYFPELREPLLQALPKRCVVDGEVVIAGEHGLDFDALLLRIHPAASRVALLAAGTPASYVAWDLLALGDDDLRARPFAERRARLVEALGHADAGAGGRALEHGTAGEAGRSVVLATPATTDRAVAVDWFERFEGAGLDGVVAKRLDSRYEPGKRAMVKVKHQRTADCAVAGFRWYRDAPGEMVGSLLLGLYDDAGTLHHVGVTSSFTREERRALVSLLAPLRDGAIDGHPWGEWKAWEEEAAARGQRVPGGTSRWNRGRDLSWEALRVERVCEVAYDHLQGDRFRHATTFLRWRPDRAPRDCRYDQLDATPPYELRQVFGGA
jgi:ATP-dependent DNA ligase